MHSKSVYFLVLLSKVTFMLFYTSAVCDNQTHPLGVIQDSFEIQPPPRNSPLAGCRYKWQMQDPDDLDISENTMLIVTVRADDSTAVSPITDGWMVTFNIDDDDGGNTVLQLV